MKRNKQGNRDEGKVRDNGKDNGKDNDKEIEDKAEKIMDNEDSKDNNADVTMRIINLTNIKLFNILFNKLK